MNEIIVDGVIYTETDIKELLNIRDKHEHNCELIDQLTEDMGKTTDPVTNFKGSLEGVVVNAK